MGDPVEWQLCTEADAFTCAKNENSWVPPDGHRSCLLYQPSASIVGLLLSHTMGKFLTWEMNVTSFIRSWQIWNMYSFFYFINPRANPFTLEKRVKETKKEIFPAFSQHDMVRKKFVFLLCNLLAVSKSSQSGVLKQTLNQTELTEINGNPISLLSSCRILGKLSNLWLSFIR